LRFGKYRYYVTFCDFAVLRSKPTVPTIKKETPHNNGVFYLFVNYFFAFIQTFFV